MSATALGGGSWGTPRGAAASLFPLAFPLGLALGLAVGLAPAARADADSERREGRARVLVEALVAGPNEPARRELYDLGKPGLAALAQALERVDDPAAWLRIEAALTEALRARLDDLDRRMGELGQRGAMAPAGSPAPVLEGEAAAAVEAIEAELAAAGYAAAAEIARPGPGRDGLAATARQALLDDLAALLAKAATGPPAERDLLRDRLVRLGWLSQPLVRALVGSSDPAARGFGDAVLAAQLARFGAALAEADPAARRLAGESLFALGDLARGRLEALATDPAAPPHASWSAAELLQRIRYGITEALYERTGDLLYGFAELPWKARRLRAFELEKQGGPEAIPALRAILAEDPSDEVRFLAAESLARLGDTTGFAYLAGLGKSFLRQSPELLAAIAMDQGIRYLQIRRFDKALVEFQRVLDLDPENDIALYNLACTHALMGAVDRALDFLERSAAAGFDNADHMLKDADLVSLREHPRFLALVARLRAAAEGSGDR